MFDRSRITRIFLQLVMAAYFFYWIENGVAARSRQLRPFALRLLVRHEGIRGVINLRGENNKRRWWKKEKATCKALGVAHYEARLDSKKIATRVMLLDLLSAFDCAPKPFLVKCKGGADRTSFASALYFLHYDHHVSIAQRQFLPWLHFPKNNQIWLKEFVVYARESMHGKSLSEWIESEYEPENFIAWMESHGKFDTHDGIFDHSSGFAT